MAGDFEARRANSIIIRNIPYETSKGDIEELCRPFGEIVDIHIPVYHDSRRPRGIAYVEFTEQEVLQEAVKGLDNTDFKKRTIYCERSTSARKTREQMEDFNINRERRDGGRSYVCNLGFDHSKDMGKRKPRHQEERYRETRFEEKRHTPGRSRSRSRSLSGDEEYNEPRRYRPRKVYREEY